MSLAMSLQIFALRKVFGETYPDPVRVVSVGATVEALLADPQNPDWAGLSVEFCGGTHLTNTASAECFVLLEESGIAKGVRRIVGLTRTAAKEAKKRAQELQTRLNALTALPGSGELVNAFKAIKLEVDTASVSLVDKELMKKTLNTVYETIKAYNKSNLAEKLVKANVTAESVAKAAVAQEKALVVVQIDFGADGKVAKKIHDKLKGEHAEGSFFVASYDDDEEK